MERIRKAGALGAAAAALLLALGGGGAFAASPSPAASPTRNPEPGGAFTLTPSPAPTTTPGPKATLPPTQAAEAQKRAAEWVGRFQRGDIDRSQLTADFSATLDKAAVAQIKSVLPKTKPLSLDLVYTDSASGNNLYVFNVNWPEGTLQFSFGITPGGKIATAYFRQ